MEALSCGRTTVGVNGPGVQDNSVSEVAVTVCDATDSSSDEVQDCPPPFPSEVFPPRLERFCQEVADSKGTPADYPGLAMLVTAAAAIGNSRALCLKENTWYESPRFYGILVGDPASGKTPAMQAVVRPYETFQVRLLKQSAAKSHADQGRHPRKRNRRSTLAELPAVSEIGETSSVERLVAMDATVESLAPLLQGNPRGLLMSLDEGVAWVGGMNQYKGGRGNDRQFWLSTWSGKCHIVDRKTQKEGPISIPRPFLNVVCGIQPDMLGELTDVEGRRDGFLDRLLFVFPRSSSGMDWTEAAISTEAMIAWENALAALRRLDMQSMEDGVPGYQVVSFAPAAKERWIEWWNSHAAEIRSPVLPSVLIGPWGKLKTYAARLALVLHYLWLVEARRSENNVDVASVERAIRLIDYFKNHMRIVYDRLRQTSHEAQLQEVLDWIRKNDGTCTARDLVRAKKASPTDKAKQILAELVELEYGYFEAREARNNKKVLWFVLDPK